MTEYRRQDLTEVEQLLETRQQLAGWLERLELAGSKTPPSVRDRVRSDYQGRLTQVVEQLRGHSDVISTTLNGLRTQAEEYEAHRAEEQETLAEAELRHGVGEYTDDEWRKVERDASGKIRGLDEELDRLSGEIGRLEEVLRQITPPAASAAPLPRRRSETHLRAVEPPAAREEPVAPAPEPREAEPAHAEPPEAPRFVPRGGLKPRESGPAKTLPFPTPAAARESAPQPAPQVDELTFLKSMTLDPRNAVGAGAAAVTEVRPADRPATPVVGKTLKCGECGALNRPTEWYCERCGAELAAV